jgi:hypothetical protein
MSLIKRLIPYLGTLFVILLSVSFYIVPILEVYLYIYGFLLENFGYHNELLFTWGMHLRRNPLIPIKVLVFVIFLSSRKWTPYLIKFHSFMTVYLSMMTQILEIITQTYQQHILATNTIPWAISQGVAFIMTFIIFYCIVSALRAKVPQVPLLTEAVEIQISDGRRRDYK